ncbi:MAG: ATP synthase F1 subunit gamma [Parcubacteria group bacterium]|nr:ATP synthase F1 subunit gamma [Parcubacteria group bacterium]
MALKEVKNKIRSVERTHTVTKAMEAVSAVKMRKTQEHALSGRAYAHSALNILKRVSGSLEASSSPLVVEREIKKVCFLVVTSDKGLAGALNSALLREAEKRVIESGLSKDAISIISIGKKGYEYFSNRGYEVLKNYENFGDDVAIESIEEVTKQIVELYKSEKIDQCIVLYTHFKSTFEQDALSRVLLPLSLEEINRVVKWITPKEGKFSDVGEKEERLNYTLEPESADILEALLPFLLNIEVYHTLLESKASEHSARMVAMKNASDKARDLTKELKLKFNKERQSLITREVSEIIGGIESMA